MKRIKICLFLLLSAHFMCGQDYGINAEVKIGVREDLDKVAGLLRSNADSYNFLDAFEYELTLELKEYIENNTSLKVTFVKVNQSEREDLLADGLIDALLFSFSKTEARMERGINFSYPYLQNRAVVLVSGDPEVTINDLGTTPIEVGYIENSTGEVILRDLKERIGQGLIINGFENYTALLDAVSNNRIDAVAGDISRFAFDLSRGELFLAGDLPLPKAKVRDEYCIGVSPQKNQLVDLFDEFILNRRFVIQSLEDKWLSSAINYIYQDYYVRSNKKEEDKRPIYVLVFCVVVLVVLLALMWRRNIQISKDNLDASVSKSVEGIIHSYERFFEKKFKAVIEDDEIVEKAIDTLENTTERLYYLGSGGMLSNANKEVSEKWQNVMFEALEGKDRPDLVIRRVLDLPELTTEIKENNEVTYSLIGIDFEGLTDKEIQRYVYQYLKWMIIVYHSLLAFPTRMSLYVSRGAPLWGYGMVTILGDSSGVMFSSHYNETLGKMQKLGTSLINPDWIEKLKEGISGVQKLGSQFDASHFRKKYLQLSQLDELAEMVKQYAEKNGSVNLDEIVRLEIERQCEQFSKKFTR